jgi:hypothetical protein
MNSTLPMGWKEASPGGMATNRDQEFGGIIDKNMIGPDWFIVFHRSDLNLIDGLQSRAEAFRIFEEQIQRNHPDSLAVNKKAFVACDEKALPILANALAFSSAYDSVKGGVTVTMTEEVRAVIISMPADFTVMEVSATQDAAKDKSAQVPVPFNYTERMPNYNYTVMINRKDQSGIINWLDTPIPLRGALAAAKEFLSSQIGQFQYFEVDIFFEEIETKKILAFSEAEHTLNIVNSMPVDFATKDISETPEVASTSTPKSVSTNDSPSP